MSTAQTLPAPIYIVGSPRSGTTLCQNLLSAHPNIALFRETHFLTIWYKLYRHWDMHISDNRHKLVSRFYRDRTLKTSPLSEQDILNLWEMYDEPTMQNLHRVLLESYAHALQKQRWGEKTPDYYHTLHTLFSWYPDAVVIFLIRDPRATVASLRQTPWANPYTAPNTHHWVRVMQQCRHWSSDKRVLTVRYEDLVSQTEQTLQQICRHVGEDYKPVMLKAYADADIMVSGTTQWYHMQEQKLRKPISTAATMRWKSELSPMQIAYIEQYTRDYMRQYRYEPVLPCSWILWKRLYWILAEWMSPFGSLKKVKHMAGLVRVHGMQILLLYALRQMREIRF